MSKGVVTRMDGIDRSRRALLAGGTATILLPGCASMPRGSRSDFGALETRLGGGELGVAALDVATGRRLEHRAHDRFAMCSTFKWVLGGLVLQGVEQGHLRLDDAVPYGPGDLVPHAPFTERRLAQGLTATVGELCAATIGTSDNAAANLLLRRIGGPPGFTLGVRALGDRVTRLDRWEPALNENAPGDPRDSTTPAAMVGLLQRFLFGAGLKQESREILRGWMAAASTGLDRLRGGFPSGWSAGDKTGTGPNGANGDVAFALVPGKRPGPLLIACFIEAPQISLDEQNAVHRAVARQVVATLFK